MHRPANLFRRGDQTSAKNGVWHSSVRLKTSPNLLPEFCEVLASSKTLVSKKKAKLLRTSCNKSFQINREVLRRTVLLLNMFFLVPRGVPNNGVHVVSVCVPYEPTRAREFQVKPAGKTTGSLWIAFPKHGTSLLFFGKPINEGKQQLE